MVKVSGIGSSAGGLGIIIGSVVSWFIVEAEGLAAGFAFGGVMMLIGTAVFMVLTRGVETSEQALSRSGEFAEAAGGQ